MTYEPNRTTRTCPNCGLRHARGEDVDPCASCLLDGWAVGLGLSICRFVRRAEVERLVDAVHRETSRYALAVSDHNKPRAFACAHRLDAALDRLAALAMEDDHG